MQKYTKVLKFANVTASAKHTLLYNVLYTYDKLYYKISDVADIIGEPQSTLRFWEREFTTLRPKRSERGTRLYTPKDIEKLRLIRYLIKDKGLKIEAAKLAIRNDQAATIRRFNAVSKLRNIRQSLVELLSALDARRK